MEESERAYWRNGLKEFDAANELIALGICCAFTKPLSWLDVGCGTGAVVWSAEALGILSFGVDQLVETDGIWFKRVDLTQPLDLGRTFELVTCIEVAEHLQEEYEGVICDTLARHVAPGGRLVFTAATPGQIGYDHFNCQPKKYWTDRLESRGLVYNYRDTERLAEIWRWTYTNLNHLPKNLQVFTR
jgi:SAM-dependent methyltransferase